MTSAADTVEILDLLGRVNGDAHTLLIEVINSVAGGRLTCEEIAIATERILYGVDKNQVLEDLVHLANLRLIGEAIPDE